MELLDESITLEVLGDAFRKMSSLSGLITAEGLFFLTDNARAHRCATIRLMLDTPASRDALLFSIKQMSPHFALAKITGMQEFTEVMQKDLEVTDDYLVKIALRSLNEELLEILKVRPYGAWMDTSYFERLNALMMQFLVLLAGNSEALPETTHLFAHRQQILCNLVNKETP